VVSSFAGAFGSALRETRLTAMLGYLIALEPKGFCNILKFRGIPLSVSLEMHNATGRSDIVVETSAGWGVIEAKITTADPSCQSLKYPAKWRVLLTEHMASSRQKRMRAIKYLRWRDLVRPLEELKGRSTDSRFRFVSQDLLDYLGEHAMVRAGDAVEIYAREINREDTLKLFLHAHMYVCPYQKSRRLAEALYFAPHFGQRIARKHPGIQAGISYIAKVEQVEVAETWEELQQIVGKRNGKRWLKGHMNLLETLHQEWKGPSKKSLVFLSRPRLVFNPPVPKDRLQKGKGWLNTRTFSFDELFEAWGLLTGTGRPHSIPI